MAISSAYLIGTAVNSIGIGSSGHTTISSNTSGYYDPRYWDKTEYERRRYEEEMERQRHASMQQMAYDHNRQVYGGITDKQRQEAQKPIKAAQPEYLTNQKLLLLGEAT
jgi:hypothetical protein